MENKNPFQAHLDNEKALIRQYPLQEEEDFFSSAAMFPINILAEAFQYFNQKAIGEKSAERFFRYLYSLEADVKLKDQRCQP